MEKFLETVKKIKADFFNNITLENKIILMFTGSLAIFFLIVGFTLISRIYENRITNIGDSVRSELVTKDNAILALENSLKGKIKMFAKDEVLLYEKNDISRAIRAFMINNDEFSQVFYGRNDGEFIENPKAARENSFDPRNTLWYKEAIADKNNIMVVNAPFQGLDGTAKVGFYSAVISYESTHGVIGGTIDFASLVKMSGDTKNLIILDNDDNIVFNDQNASTLFKKLNKANMGDLSLAGQKNDGISKVALENKNMLAIVYKSETTKLKYIKLIDYDKAMALTNMTKYIIIGAFIIILIISFTLCKLLYKDIKKYLRNIEAQTEAIGEGKLDEVKVLQESSDEVGRLSFAFGQMAGNVKSRLMTMETESQNLRALLKELLDVIGEMKTTCESSVTNFETFANASDIQLKNIESVSGEVKNIAQDVATISNLQKQWKTDISAAASNMEKTLNRITAEADSSSTKFAAQKEKFETAFKADVKNLNEALKTIADNASEISLMAFSAALEAAKIKDEKSKFAKIAEDIRKLAAVVAKSANDGLNETGKFAPKILEPQSLDFKEDLSNLLKAAKSIEDNINTAETTLNRLETAGKSVKTVAEEAVLLEKDSADALQNALDRVKETQDNIEKMERIADKAFEN